jgi:hypothetical protein
MKASKLVSFLMEEILSKGDGEVVFEYFSNEYEPIDCLDVYEDEDHSGKVTKRTVVLKSY